MGEVSLKRQEGKEVRLNERAAGSRDRTTATKHGETKVSSVRGKWTEARVGLTSILVFGEEPEHEHLGRSRKGGRER